MNIWMLAWKLLFVLTIAVFIEMAVLVTWRGAGDIRRMLKRLDADDEVPGDGQIDH